MPQEWVTEDGIEVGVGTRVYNYYDMEPGEIAADAGQGWFDFRSDAGKVTLLDGSRVCSMGFARAKGWTT